MLSFKTEFNPARSTLPAQPPLHRPKQKRPGQNLIILSRTNKLLIRGATLIYGTSVRFAGYVHIPGN